VKIAAISDIHGNLYAFEAVLKDIQSKGISNVYCAGDLVGYGPRPNEVIGLIKENSIPTAMGNYDDAVANQRLVCGCDYKDEKSLRLGEASLAWTRDHTPEAGKDWLRELPGEIRFSAGGIKALLVHGSPRAINEYLHPETPADYLEGLLAECGADLLICGHTHRPYVKRLSNGWLINCGSAGRPLHGSPNATYAVLEIRGGEVWAEIVEVPYNYEDTAVEIEESGLPREFAQIIRTGRAG